MSDLASAFALVDPERLIVERRSIRRFADCRVSRQAVSELIESACWAPSPHNSQPWRFTALFEEEDKIRLGKAMSRRLREDLAGDALPPVDVDRQAKRSASRIAEAPVVLLCSLQRDGLVSYPDPRREGLEWQMAVQSVGAVLQSLFLLAAARGLGTCWMAAPMYCPDVVRDALALASDLHPQALVLMGYPSAPGKVRPRRPLGEILEIR